LGGLVADLLEGARRRNLSANSLAAYERTWRTFLAWAAAASLDPRALSFPTALEGYRFLGEGKNAASLKQIRAALSFAYKHWDLKNPFAKIEQRSLDLLHTAPQVRAIPVVVLTSDKRFDFGAGGAETWPAWRTAQERLAKLLNAKHVSDTNSGHAIQMEQPRLVIEAIREVVEAARSGRQQLAR
jgi:pimeloyl-ACP methyl ester carboxylesterase